MGSPPAHVGQGHEHGGHGHGGQQHPAGLRGFFGSLVKPHSHDSADKVDATLESSERGIWAVKISLLGLGATATLQILVVFVSGSVALLADTIHNFSDALTAIPLWIAFALAGRAASRRYTYGFGRAEDLAGMFILAMITLSAGLAGWQSFERLQHPQPLEQIGLVIVASIIGFLGNEAVAVFRIRVGNEIGSAALVADGYHARTDGFTSLAVLVGALGVLAGFPLADPIVGLAITVAILFVLGAAARNVWLRLMDAVDPALVDKLEGAAHLYGVHAVRGFRLRWLGHRLEAELEIVVDGDISTSSSHALAEAVRHALFHTEPRLAVVAIHIDPSVHDGRDHHASTTHHVSRR